MDAEARVVELLDELSSVRAEASSWHQVTVGIEREYARANREIRDQAEELASVRAELGHVKDSRDMAKEKLKEANDFLRFSTEALREICESYPSEPELKQMRAELGQLREENAVLAGRLSGLMRAAVKHDGLHIEPLVVLAGDDCESEPQATWSAVVTSGAQSTETLEYAHTFDELLDRVAARKEGRKDG